VGDYCISTVDVFMVGVETKGDIIGAELYFHENGSCFEGRSGQGSAWFFF
jgi:hypothetical protein